MSQNLKKMHICFKTKVVSGILGWIFFMMYDIDIHELNLRPLRDLKFLDEISLKKCVFFAFLNNKCITIIFFRKKTHYHIKEEEIL